jgi:hypothetical protein
LLNEAKHCSETMRQRLQRKSFFNDMLSIDYQQKATERSSFDGLAILHVNEKYWSGKRAWAPLLVLSK